MKCKKVGGARASRVRARPQTKTVALAVKEPPKKKPEPEGAWWG